MTKRISKLAFGLGFTFCMVIGLTLDLSAQNRHAPDTINFRSSFPAMSRYNFSLNIPGAITYGPMIHAEVGLTQKIRLDAHVRFMSKGFAYWLFNAPEYLPPSPGMGVVYCIPARKGHLLCLSLMGEYAYIVNRGIPEWDWHEEGWRHTKQELGILGIGVGWRMRFDTGHFVQFGGYLFYAAGTEKELGGSGDNLDWVTQSYLMKRPRISVDVRVGLEFRKGMIK